MSDYQQFPTRKAAEAEIATMRGWSARPLKMNLYANDQDAENGKTTPVYVIDCGNGKTLRTDGYVR